MPGQILTARDITADVDVSCDVCIVGSGAGGSVLAAGLAERGLRVVMLEAGGYFTRRDFDLEEATAFPAMYQGRASRASADLAISVLQGRSVGGSTTINWTTCFRTPQRILDLWHGRFGIELDGATLDPHWSEVEARLNITEWPESAANANNQVLFRGARALGHEVEALRRNVKGCANSGYCGLGCPVDAKQGMHVTYLPDALRAGLQLYANTEVERLEVVDGRVVAVHGRVMSARAAQPNGPRVVVRPKVAVSSCGALNGPMLLIRSGLGDLGPVGRRTFLHPVVGVGGIFEEAIEPYYGAPQSAASHAFTDRGEGKMGFVLEVPPLQPMLGAIASPLFGAAKNAFLRDLKHTGLLIALSVDGILPGDEGGTVSLKSDGRLNLDYPILPHLLESFREAHRVMAEIVLAAGAKTAKTLHLDPVVMRSVADLPLLDAAPYGALEHPIFTAHQMGGCAMGADPERSVVDLRLRHRHVPNLFVVDGSVFPTSLGVNPSLSIYGLAHWAVDHIAEAAS